MKPRQNDEISVLLQGSFSPVFQKPPYFIVILCFDCEGVEYGDRTVYMRPSVYLDWLHP